MNADKAGCAQDSAMCPTGVDSRFIPGKERLIFVHCALDAN